MVFITTEPNELRPDARSLPLLRRIWRWTPFYTVNRKPDRLLMLGIAESSPIIYIILILYVCVYIYICIIKYNLGMLKRN